MKKLLLLMAVFGLALIYSCSEDEPKKVVEEDPVAPELTSPVDGFSTVITAENLTDNIDFGWDAADYPIVVDISYDVELDVASGDFSGAVVLGSTAETSLSVSLEEINTALIGSLAQSANEAIAVKVRVVATAVGQDDLTSGTISMTITTYEGEPEPTYANIWVAGSFQGWDASNFISLTSAQDNGVYEGYLYLPDGQLDFKLYQNQNDWGPDSWGTDNDGSGTIYVANEACCNFVAETAGTNWVEVDIPNLTYKLINISWGVVGDATPTGWDSDTDMVYNAETKALEVTLDLTASGSFKFRANDAWAHAFGVDGDGNLVYSDHLTNGFSEGTNNLTVSEDGNYTISLDLHNSNEYTYSVVKN